MPRALQACRFYGSSHNLTSLNGFVVAGFRSVRYVRQKNAGKAAAFNRGFQTATGTILCHLDADDYWLPNKLECVTTILATTTVGGMIHGAHYVDAAGESPDFVFAIDTFVSSDSPLETNRFADATLGKGFVVRAVDNSNVVPGEYVDRVEKLAKEHNIPEQFGLTGGRNYGPVFLRYGAIDIPLGGRCAIRIRLRK